MDNITRVHISVVYVSMNTKSNGDQIVFIYVHTSLCYQPIRMTDTSDIVYYQYVSPNKLHTLNCFVSMLVQRLQRWPNIETTLAEHLVLDESLQ